MILPSFTPQPLLGILETILFISLKKNYLSINLTNPIFLFKDLLT